LLKTEPGGKYSPVWVANQLDDAAKNAADNLRAPNQKLAAPKARIPPARGGCDNSVRPEIFAANPRRSFFALYERSLTSPRWSRRSSHSTRAGGVGGTRGRGETFTAATSPRPNISARPLARPRAAMDEDIADMERF